MDVEVSNNLRAGDPSDRVLGPLFTAFTLYEVIRGADDPFAL